MKKASCGDEQRILTYIRPNLGECLYLYIDIMRYGIGNKFMELWYDENEEGISFVLMKYHNSLQLYSHIADWDQQFVLDFAEKNRINIINGKKTMIEKLEVGINETYDKKFGWVFKNRPLVSYHLGSDVKVQIAKPEDAEEIANLMCGDEQWSMYHENDLALELRERMESAMGRSFVIREGGKIVAHDATFAETDDIVVASGLIVKEDYIDKMYGAILGTEMDKIFLKEGKEKYFHIYDPERMKILQRLGHTVVAETGKLIRKKSVH